MTGNSNNPISEYLKHNIGRILELVIILTVIFVNVQSTVKTQGETLDLLVEQQREHGEAIRGLAIALAEMGVSVRGIKDDVEEVEDDLQAHEVEDNSRDTQLKKHVYGEHP